MFDNSSSRILFGEMDADVYRGPLGGVGVRIEGSYGGDRMTLWCDEEELLAFVQAGITARSLDTIFPTLRCIIGHFVFTAISETFGPDFELPSAVSVEEAPLALQTWPAIELESQSSKLRLAIVQAPDSIWYAFEQHLDFGNARPTLPPIERPVVIGWQRLGTAQMGALRQGDGVVLEGACSITDGQAWILFDHQRVRAQARAGAWTVHEVFDDPESEINDCVWAQLGHLRLAYDLADDDKIEHGHHLHGNLVSDGFVWLVHRDTAFARCKLLKFGNTLVAKIIELVDGQDAAYVEQACEPLSETGTQQFAFDSNTVD